MNPPDLKKVGTEFVKFLAWWRESLIVLPLVCAVLVLVIMWAIPAFTQREAMFDAGILGDYAMRLVAICFVIALVGFLKGKAGILPDVDEDSVTDWSQTPWQLVAIDAGCTLFAICFLSWLLVR